MPRSGTGPNGGTGLRCSQQLSSVGAGPNAKSAPATKNTRNATTNSQFTHGANHERVCANQHELVAHARLTTTDTDHIKRTFHSHNAVPPKPNPPRPGPRKAEKGRVAGELPRCDPIRSCGHPRMGSGRAKQLYRLARPMLAGAPRCLSSGKSTGAERSGAAGGPAAAGAKPPKAVLGGIPLAGGKARRAELMVMQVPRLT